MVHFSSGARSKRVLMEERRAPRADLLVVRGIRNKGFLRGMRTRSIEEIRCSPWRVRP